MYHRLFVHCLSLCLVLSACKPQGSSFVPVTGEESIAAPAQVEQARNTVIKYATTSARLASLPRDAEWELETGRQSEKEYRYHNGDWLIVIRLADTVDGNRQVMVCNQVEHANWTGYVTANGDVVDTHYVR
jgi:uncharacterized membrane-anchored protein